MSLFYMIVCLGLLPSVHRFYKPKNMPDTPSLDLSSVLLGGGVVLLCLLWWLSTRRPSGLPPGPGPALPLLGHLHLMAKDPRPKFWVWRRRYGDVFSLYMGGRLVVVLASYSAIHEAFVTFADVFSDRPDMFISRYVLKYQGVAMSSGPTWKEQRKTALEILRAMGMGKNVLADKIQEEITHYIRAIKEHQGAPLDLARMTQVSVSNNICSIIMGKRFHYNDPQFVNYIALMNRNFELLIGTSILNFFPLLRKIPGDLVKGEELLANFRNIFNFLGKSLADHQKTLDNDKDHTDFIYSYLRQIQNVKALGNVDSTLSVEHLHKTIGNLFAGGTETTSTAIRWTLLFFLHHPHVQDKCFKEISDVIGLHRPPSMSDKPNLTYLEATICEVLRKGNIVPLGAMHAPSRDVIFRGYVIPKGTMVIPVLDCVLEDPDVWGDPENFRPERFIGPDGKIMKPKEFIPFSAGRRLCLGESLARMELFLYLATLIQHFHFLPPEEGQLPSLKGEVGFTHPPQLYKVRAVPRM